MAIDIESMRIFRAGAAALIARLCDVLKIPEIIDSVVQWDPTQCYLSPGTRVKALIINILVDRRALCHVDSFYEHQDLEVLFGTARKLKPEDFNDDALGRALDKLFASGQMKRLFSTIALRAAAIHNVPIEGIHADTTSVCVEGAYEGEGDLDITYGFSKDKRPDLKQFKIGLVVNKYGLPFLGHSLDGNMSDKVWYPQVIEELVQVFSAEKLKEIVFVADCALVTKENLRLLAGGEDRPAIKFISLLPENFGINREIKEEAFRLGKWQEIGSLSQKKEAAQYKSQSFMREIEGRSYRLIVVHSTALDKRKEQGLLKKWAQQRGSLEAAARELSRRAFACEADARKAIEIFSQEHRHLPFVVSGTVSKEEIKSYPKPGRPKKGMLPQSKVVYYARIQVEEDKEAMAREKELASTFVLITNLLDAKEHPDREVIKEYKEQSLVERQF
ncbi:MAG: IS1634 family transposase, partial [Moorellaceae bacterium]